MARQLRTLLYHLDLDPRTLELRNGAAELPMEPAGAARWVSSHATPWVTTGNTWHLYAAELARTGSGYDPDAPAEVRTPTLVAAGMRAVEALEVFTDAPEGTAVAYRLHDGTDAWWWDGATWAVAGAGDWNTQAELQEHAPSWKPTRRRLAVVAQLSTTSTGATPRFYGARVALGLRDVADGVDALVYALQATLEAEIRVPYQLVLPSDGTGVFHLNGSPPDTAIDFTEVAAVFNLTTDPAEATELPGTFTEDPDTFSRTWTADAPVPDQGAEVLLEAFHAPYVVAMQQDGELQVDRVPAVVLEPTGVPVKLRGQELQLVRDFLSAQPSGYGVAYPSTVLQDVQVRALSGSGEDAGRIADALAAFVNGGRVLVSPETGRLVHVQEVEAHRATTGELAMGVHEHRAAWRLTYTELGQRSGVRYNMVRPGGVQTSVED